MCTSTVRGSVWVSMPQMSSMSCCRVKMCPGEETSNEWCEPVTDAEYAALDADCAQNP